MIVTLRSDRFQHLGVTVNGRALFQGDIVQDHMINSVFGSRQKRGLPRQEYRIWEKNTIPYLLDNNLGAYINVYLEYFFKTLYAIFVFLREKHNSEYR